MDLPPSSLAEQKEKDENRINSDSTDKLCTNHMIFCTVAIWFTDMIICNTQFHLPPACNLYNKCVWNLQSIEVEIRNWPMQETGISHVVANRELKSWRTSQQL